MLNRIVVGTLSTLNTLMTPLAGTPGPKNFVFKLEAPIESQVKCPSLKRTPLLLNVDPAPDSRLSLRVSGRICIEGQKTKPVAIAVSLPEDLFDAQFIEELPVNTPYVVSESKFGIPSLPGKARLKLTKRASVEGLIPLVIEWVPSTVNEKPLHEAVTIWLRKMPTEGVRPAGLAWERIELRGLENLSAESFALKETPGERTQKLR